MSVIAVRNLTKRYGKHIAVDNVTLNVEPGEIMGFLGPNGSGEIMGFLGPNGSGKTTTIRMICGLLTPDAGSGTVLGHNVLTESTAIKREAGYMTQRFSFYEDLTIAENLTFVARLYGLKPAEPVREALDHLGLTARAHQLAGTLSGGWKQRLALAACILHKPKLLLLDEPTAGVDPKARREFWDEIHKLAGQGLTVLVSTHYMDEAERCHRITYISNGRLLATGTVNEVVEAAGLTTFVLEGSGLTALEPEIIKLPGVDQVAPFGASLHVVGRDAGLLEQSLTAYAAARNMAIRPGETSLEDVFIQFMAKGRET